MREEWENTQGAEGVCGDSWPWQVSILGPEVPLPPSHVEIRHLVHFLFSGGKVREGGQIGPPGSLT